VTDVNGRRIVMFQNEINSARNANVYCNFLCSMNGFDEISFNPNKQIQAAISF